MPERPLPSRGPAAFVPMRLFSSELSPPSTNDPSSLLPEITLPAPLPVPADRVVGGASVDNPPPACCPEPAAVPVDAEFEKLPVTRLPFVSNMDSGTARKVINVQPANRAAGRKGSAYHGERG